MTRKNISALALSGILAVSTSMAMARESSKAAQSSGALDRIESLVQKSQLQLRAELVLLEILIQSLETTQIVNEYLQLDRANVYVQVPGVLTVGLGSAVYGTRMADFIVRAMTPEKSAWFAEHAQLKAAVKQAKLAFESAKLTLPATPALPMVAEAAETAAEAAMASVSVPPASASLSSAEAEIALLRAEKAVAQHLLQQPGGLYKFGRIFRPVARTAVVVGGVTLAIVTVNETVLLVMGRDQMAQHLQQFKEKAAKIEALLN